MAENEGLRHTGEAIVLSILPDVCLTPPAMLPVPYQIMGRFSDSIRYADTVRMTELNAVMMDSRLTTVYGDELGTGGGIFSGVNKGWCRPITYSSTVRAQGHHITYHTSFYWMNCSGPEGTPNTIGRAIYVENVGAVYIGPLGTIIGNTTPIIQPETKEEKGILHQAFGVVKGFGKGAWDMAKGVAHLGKTAFYLGNPVLGLVDPSGLHEAVDTAMNLAKVGFAFSPVGMMLDPRGSLKTGVRTIEGIAKPYREAWAKGEYGEAIGRGIFDILTTIGTDGLGEATEVGRVGEVTNVLEKSEQTLNALSKEEEFLTATSKGEQFLTEPLTEDGIKISESSNSAKGLFGEIKADEYMSEHGFEKIGGHGPKPQGIDGVYKNLHPPPEYVIGEAKYGNSGYGETNSGKQMSDEWIDFRLDEAVGKEQADIIRKSGYEKWELRVDKFGNVVKKEINW